MHYLLTMCLALIFSCQGIQANCRINEEEDNSCAHLNCSKQCVAHASAFSENYPYDGQQIPEDCFIPICFETNAYCPCNISHPYQGNTNFRIKLDGFYLIGWTMSLIHLLTLDNVHIQLWDATAQQPIGPNPFQIETLVDGAEFIDGASGQTIAYLTKGTVLQLRVQSNPISQAGVLRVFNPTLFITRIAN